MLSLFPEMLFLAPFSALLIRLALAVLLAYAAWQHVTVRDLTIRSLSFVEAILAAALIVGAWTQGIAILAFILLALHALIPRLRLFATSTVLLALVICASLVVTGAGPLAFDLPL